jgi:hypothetical protein
VSAEIVCHGAALENRDGEIGGESHEDRGGVDNREAEEVAEALHGSLPQARPRLEGHAGQLGLGEMADSEDGG